MLGLYSRFRVWIIRYSRGEPTSGGRSGVWTGAFLSYCQQDLEYGLNVTRLWDVSRQTKYQRLRQMQLRNGLDIRISSNFNSESAFPAQWRAVSRQRISPGALRSSDEFEDNLKDRILEKRCWRVLHFPAFADLPRTILHIRHVVSSLLVGKGEFKE